MSAMAIVAGAAVAVGAGVSMYGANKNKKAIESANKANQEIAKDANDRNYQMWRESRGVLEDGSAVNTKMPRWMSVRVNGEPTIKRALVKKGQAVPAASQITPYSRVKASPYVSPKDRDPLGLF